jgi:hypothetical protein
VVEANFCNGADCLFKEVDLKGHGAVLEPELAQNIGRLVKLGDKKEYKFDIPIVDGYTYIPYLNHFAVTCNPGPFCVNVPCCVAKAGLGASYGVMLAYFRLVKPLVDPIKYEFGRFYDNPDGQDVRFTYYVELESAPVIFGRNVFDDIPPILAVATGKPYGGYLGTELERGLTWSQRSGREISYTYKAKLVPTRFSTLMSAAVQSGNSPDTRFLTVVH